MEIRLNTADDLDASWQLGRRAFGGPAEVPTSRLQTEGRDSYGAYVSGQILAKAVDLHVAHFFGGRSVPSVGFAGVATAPEARGTGLGRQVLTYVLERGRERGAVISTLFPTVPAVYRRLGWETIGTLRTTRVPTASLADVRGGTGTLRAATKDDLPALDALFAEVGARSSGTTDRRAPFYVGRAESWFAEADGVTLVESDAGLEGCLVWERGRGYGADAVLTVDDVVARTPDALATLLRCLASWASVTPTLLLRLADDDPALLLSGFAGATVHTSQPWMLRLVDAPGAVAARGWQPVSGSVDLHLTDAECPWNAGDWRLELDGGAGRLVRGGSGEVRLTARAAGAWFAGTPLAVLRAAGLVDGPAVPLMDAAAAGPRPSLVDYF